jgi:hypothetical protein
MEHHQHQQAGNLQHEAGIINITLSWKSSARSWHLINISTKLEIFSTKLASQQHQHEAGNLQHEAGITTTSTRSTKLASQQHHEAGNLQHKAGITTTSARSWKSSAQGWHHINIICNRMRQVQQHFVVL